MVSSKPPFSCLFVTDQWVHLFSAQFTTVMHERHNTRMVIFGGKPHESLEYKGMAGNQVLEWVDIDSEIKTAHLKNVRLPSITCSPSYLTNSPIL